QVFNRCVALFRQVEPDRPIVCVFEDIDAIIAVYGDSDLLQWLDGNQQVDRAGNLASTNYPEKLDRRIIARPRRFDRILRIATPGCGPPTSRGSCRSWGTPSASAGCASPRGCRSRRWRSW